MLSIDTSILLHACTEDSPSHRAAYAWLASIQRVEDVAISEFIRSPSAGGARVLESTKSITLSQVFQAAWSLIYKSIADLIRWRALASDELPDAQPPSMILRSGRRSREYVR